MLLGFYRLNLNTNDYVSTPLFTTKLGEMRLLKSTRLLCRGVLRSSGIGGRDIWFPGTHYSLGGIQESSSSGISMGEEGREVWLNGSLCGPCSFKRMSQSHSLAWQCWVTDHCGIPSLPILFSDTQTHWHTPQGFGYTVALLTYAVILFLYRSLTAKLWMFHGGKLNRCQDVFIKCSSTTMCFVWGQSNICFCKAFSYF